MGTRRLLVKIVTEYVDKGVKESKKDVESLADKLKNNLGNIAAGAVVAAGAAAVKFTSDSIKSFESFEKGMSEVFTLLPGISEEAMGKMRQDVLDFSAATGQDATASIGALYDSLSAGVPPQNVFSFLEAANAASLGGVTDIGTAVDGLSSVVNAYGKGVISAGEASDIMFTAVRLGKTTFGELSNSLFNVIPTAASLGVSFQDVAQNLSALTAAGTPTSVATTQLRQAFVEASKSGTELDKALRNLHGKGFADLIASGMTSSQIFLSLRESMPEQAFRNLFGSVEAANAVLGITNDTALGVIESFTGIDGATDAAASTMSETAAQVDKELKAAFEVLKITIGEELTPEVIEFKRALIDLIEITIKTVGPTIRIVQTLNDLARKATTGQATMDDYKSALRDVSSESLDLIAALEDATKPVEEMSAETLIAAEAAASYDQKLSNYIVTANAAAVATKAEAEAIRMSAQARALAAGGNDELSDKLVQTNNHLSEQEAMVAAANAANKSYFDGIKDGTEAIGIYDDAQRELNGRMGEYFDTALQAGESTESLEEMLYREASAAGAPAEALALLATLTGNYSTEQIEAALKTAAMSEKARELGQAIADGSISIQQARIEMVTFQAELENPLEPQFNTDSINTGIEQTAALISEIKNIPLNVATSIVMNGLDDSKRGIGELITLINQVDGRSASASVTVNTSAPGDLGSGSSGGGKPSGKAVGGPVNEGQPYIIGERGPELFVPNTSGTIVPNGGFGGFTDNSQTNIHNYNQQAAAITATLVQQQRRRKFDAYMGVG